MKLFAWVIALLVATSGVAEAAPVAAGIAAVSSWTVTIGATQFAVGAFLVNTVSSIALSALSMALRGKPKIEQPGITTNTTTAGGVVPQRLVFGRYATGGQHVCPPMVYQTDGNPNEWLVYVISLADKPITALRQIIINGKKLSLDGDPAAAANGDLMGATVIDSGDKSLRNKVYVRFHNGRQTAADPYLMRVFSTYPERPWQADMIGTGVAYAVVTFKGKSQDGDYQGFPQVKFEVDGHALYDPRDAAQNPDDEGTWKFTRNPAVIAYNILRGIDIPGGDRWGVGARKFLLAYMLAAANVCDAAVPVEGGGTRVRYQAGLEVGVDTEPHQALTEVLKAMGGDVADMGGTWIVRAGPPAGPVLSITDDDIIVTDTRSLRPYPGLAETVNAIHASYPDPDQQWEAKEAVPLYDPALEVKDGGRRLIADVSFPAVTDPRQVRALMREMLADHRRHRTHVITLPPDAAGLCLGDHIAWSSVTNGYSGKLFKVAQMMIDPVSLCVAVTLIERDPADYDYDAGSDAKVPTIPSPRPVEPAIAGVFGWAVSPVVVQGATGARPGIRIAWNPEIGADALVWTIKLASTGAVVARGDVRALAEGFIVVTSGLLPATQYLVTGRLVMRRKTLATQETPVVTDDVRIGVTDLAAEVAATLQRADDFIDGAPALLDDIRSDVAADVAAVDGRVTAARADLSADVASARQLAIDNLDLAKNYTDTSVQSETVARQTEAGQLAARIDQITAAATSGNLLVNGDFADGATGWSGVTVSGGRATVGSSGGAQTFASTFAAGELLQWRVSYTSPVAAAVRVQFYDSSNAALGSEFVTSLAASATDKVASGQHAPPDGAASVRWRFVGNGASIDNAAASRIDQQMLARIQSLETAVATDVQALANYKTEVTARFGTTNAAISDEASTRASADNAIAARTTALETTTDNHNSRITTTETTLASATESIAQVQQLTEAESGRRDLVRDGTFEMVGTYWPSGALPVRLVARNAASTDQRVKSVPAARYWNLAADDAAGTWRVSGYQPVTPGEVVEVSFDYARNATSVVPAVRIQTFNADKTQLQTWAVEGRGTGGWQRASGALTVSTDAVYARVLVGVGAAGSSTAGITNVSAMRTGAGYASRGTVEALAQSQADDVQALANYKVAVTARFEDVEGKTKANADAIVLTYTKAQTNEAISGQISSYDATVVSRLGLKASVNTVSALDSRVQDTENGLTAVSNAVTATNADVGRFKANGMFRVNSVATPSGALSRIALSAAVEAGDITRAAGLYLEAVSGSKSRAVVVADQFAVVSAADGPAKFPFIVEGDNISMDADVWVKNLTIGPEKIKVNGLTTLRSASVPSTSAPSSGETVAGTLSFTPYEAGTKLLISLEGTATSALGAGSTPSDYRCDVKLYLNGTRIGEVAVDPGGGSGSSFTAKTDSIDMNRIRVSAAGTNTIQVRVSNAGRINPSVIRVQEFNR